MKRKNKSDLKPVFTFFIWHPCLCCGEEFQREAGWKKETGPYYGGRGREKYLCETCVPSNETAEKLFNQISAERMRRPPPPPLDYSL